MLPADQIDLASRQFGPLSCSIVVQLIQRYRPPIWELALDKNPIHPEGAAELAKMLATNDDIKLLDVRFCGLHAEGIAALCDALRVNTSVNKVLALCNNLNAEGAAAIEALLRDPNCSLQYIDVQDNFFPPPAKATLVELGAKIGAEVVV